MFHFSSSDNGVTLYGSATPLINRDVKLQWKGWSVTFSVILVLAAWRKTEIFSFSQWCLYLPQHYCNTPLIVSRQPFLDSSLSDTDVCHSSFRFRMLPFIISQDAQWLNARGTYILLYYFSRFIIVYQINNAAWSKEMPKRIQVRVEQRVMNMTFTQKTRVCIPFKIKHHH